jgi:hypothetical protein
LVLIAPGTYNERLTIDSAGVKLQGSGIGITTIDETTDSGHAITITGDDTAIRNLSVATTATGGNGYDGINIGADRCEIERVRVTSSDGDGIRIEGANFLNITRCAFGTIDNQAITSDDTSASITIAFCNFVTISGANDIGVNHDNGTIVGCHGNAGSTRAVALGATSSEITVVGNNFKGAVLDSGTNNLVDANNS